MYDTQARSEVGKLSAIEVAKRKALERDVIELAKQWNEGLKRGESEWKPMPQIRLSNAVDKLNDFLKYG